MKTLSWMATALFAVFASSCLAGNSAQELQKKIQELAVQPPRGLTIQEEHPALPLGPYWVPDWLRNSLKAPPPAPPIAGPAEDVSRVFAALPSAHPSLGEIGKKPVALEIDRTDASEAIMNLLEAAGVSYVVGGDIPTGRRITARFRNVPLQDALDALAEAAGLSYSLKGNVIVLRATGFLSVITTPPPGMRPPVSLPPTPPAKPKLDQPKSQPQTKPQSKPGAGQKSSSLPEKSSTTSFIALSHTSAVDVLQRLGAQGAKLPPGLEVVAAVPDGNAVVARGTKNALQELQKAISELDVPGKMVEVQTSVFTVPESGLKAALPERFLSQPEFVLSELEAEQIIGKLKSSGAVALCQPVVRTLESQPAAVSISEPQNEQFVSFWVRPRINSDKSVTLSLSFSDRKDAAQQAAALVLPPVAAGEAVPMHASQVIRRLEPGKVLFFIPPTANPNGEAGKTLVAVKAKLISRG